MIEKISLFRCHCHLLDYYQQCCVQILCAVKEAVAVLVSEHLQMRRAEDLLDTLIMEWLDTLLPLFVADIRNELDADVIYEVV